MKLTRPLGLMLLLLVMVVSFLVFRGDGLSGPVTIVRQAPVEVASAPDSSEIPLVEAEAPSITEEVSSGDDELESVELAPSAVLRGRIVNEDGIPLAQAAIVAAGQESQTDAEGRFTFEELAEGPAAVVASHADYRDEEIQLNLSAGKVHDVQLVLKRGGSIVGRVLESDVALAGVEIDATRADNLQVFRGTLTEDDGTFRISGLEPGEWRVLAESHDASRLWQLVVVESGQETPVEFVFGAPASVEGLVILDGRPAANAVVGSHSISGSGEQFAETRTNEGGWYRLEIAPGTIVLSAEVRPDGSAARRKSVTQTVPAGRSEYDFEFGKSVSLSGEIEGVTAEETVNLYVFPEGYSIDFESESWGTDLERDAIARTTADGAGLFSIDSMEPGIYALAVVAFVTLVEEGADPLSTARIIEREVEVHEAGAHLELGF